MPLIESALKSGEISASEWRRLCLLTPQWLPESRELCVGLHVVKDYQQPAREQQLVLTSFEDVDWRRLIGDPLPMKPGKDPKRRLNYTIRNLNRCQRDPSIHFFAARNGQGLGWQIVFEPLPKR